MCQKLLLYIIQSDSSSCDTLIHCDPLCLIHYMYQTELEGSTVLHSDKFKALSLKNIQELLLPD